MKHGLSVVPLKFHLSMTGVLYPVLVSVYVEDGTVAISHGGVEIGQGINTKVAQVAAMTLGISLDMINLKPCSTITSPNTAPTGGSTTSEFICMVSSTHSDPPKINVEALINIKFGKVLFFHPLRALSQLVRCLMIGSSLSETRTLTCHGET